MFRTYTVHTPTGAYSAATLSAVAWTLIGLGKGDPEVTYMPRTVADDGSPLTDAEASDLDWWVERHSDDYDRIPALPG